MLTMSPRFLPKEGRCWWHQFSLSRSQDNIFSSSPVSNVVVRIPMKHICHWQVDIQGHHGSRIRHFHQWKYLESRNPNNLELSM